MSGGKDSRSKVSSGFNTITKLKQEQEALSDMCAHRKVITVLLLCGIYNSIHPLRLLVCRLCLAQ